MESALDLTKAVTVLNTIVTSAEPLLIHPAEQGVREACAGRAGEVRGECPLPSPWVALQGGSRPWDNSPTPAADGCPLLPGPSLGLCYP